jgi:hypothetical protein
MADDASITYLQLLHRLLREDVRNTARLAREAGVGYFWLRKMRSGEVKQPSFEPTIKLLLFLCSGEDQQKLLFHAR